MAYLELRLEELEGKVAELEQKHQAIKNMVKCIRAQLECQNQTNEFKPMNHGSSWKKKDEERLLLHYRNWENSVAILLERTPYAVECKLKSLLRKE